MTLRAQASVAPSGTKVPYILAQSAVPVCLPSSGTIGNNGALSGITALPVVYSAGVWMRFPANAVAAGRPAGLYWTVMSSTTAGTIYDVYADPANEFIPYIPTNPPALVTTGPGAYAQTTAADITLVNATLPGGALGNHGALRVLDLWEYSNSAGTKTLQTKVGTASLKGGSVTTTATYQDMRMLRMRGASNRFVVFTPTTTFGASTTAASEITSIDMANTQSVTQTANIAVATDFVLVAGFTYEVLPS